MNELQPRPRNSIQQPGSAGPVTISQGPVPIEILEPEVQRDYSGLREYWLMIRRHRGALICAAVLGGMAGFFLTIDDPRIYQAQTTLEIQDLNNDFLNMKNFNPVAETSGYLDFDIQTQVKILQSRRLSTRIQEKLEAQKRPDDLQPPDRLGLWRKALQMNPPDSEALWRQALGIAAGSVKVRSSGINRIVDVSCDSTSAQLAADFCNTLTREFIDENLESRWKASEYTGEWLTKQLHDLKVKLEKQQEELQSYARAASLVIAGEKSDVQETRLADLQKELSAAQADRIAKQSKYEMASTSPSGALPDVLDDASLKDSQKALSDFRARLAELRVVFTANHAEVKRVQAQISAIEGSLETARTNVLTRIHKDFEAAERRETLLANAYTGQAALVSGQAEQTAHYNLLKHEVDATRALYETLLQRLKEASIASALRANNIRVVDAAETPSSPYKPDVARMCTLGLLFGVVLGFAFVVLRERADRTLQAPGDAAHFLGVPELGVVPIAELPGRTKSKSTRLLPDAGASNGKPIENRVEMISWRQRNSMLAESFRTTLTSILFSRRNGDRPRVLVLTSPSPQEGKTTVVSNLGISLADLNQTVLLIDGDMRRPRLHALFSVKNDRGLSDVLREKAPLDREKLDAVCTPTSIPGLYVLPSGSSRRTASGLLHSPRLAELLSLARQKFDTIIVDTPPMVNIADARVVARVGDAVILVVRSGVTTRDAALLAMGRFVDDGIPLLGTILNFWNPKTPGYWYYGQYYAKYHYYYGNGSSNGNGSNSDGDTPMTDSSKESTVWTRGSLPPRLPKVRPALENES